ANRLALAEFGLAAVGAEIGDEAEAMKAYGQAIEVMETLVRERDSSQDKAELAMALNSLANLHVNAGKFREARAELDRARSLYEKLARESGTSPGSRSDLAMIHHNLGWLDSKVGRAESALAHYRKARDLKEALAREAPDQEWRRETLAQTYNNLGWM